MKESALSQAHRKRYGKKDRRRIILNRQSIEHRPIIVDAGSRIGDWEADTLIGKNHRQAIVSRVERKTRAYDYFRQRSGIHRARADQQTTGRGLLFRPALRFMGTRDEREYQWTDSTVLPHKQRLHHDYTTGDGTAMED